MDQNQHMRPVLCVSHQSQKLPIFAHGVALSSHTVPSVRVWFLPAPLLALYAERIFRSQAKSKISLIHQEVCSSKMLLSSSNKMINRQSTFHHTIKNLINLRA
jgi:hypothetical protein